MGADGPGKAEIAVAELARVRVFCDDWTQASHNGELAHAVEAGALGRDDVTELGAVLAGRRRAPIGRRDHRLRLDRARDPGPGDRAGRAGARGRARPRRGRSLDPVRSPPGGRYQWLEDVRLEQPPSGAEEAVAPVG